MACERNDNVATPRQRYKIPGKRYRALFHYRLQRDSDNGAFHRAVIIIIIFLRHYVRIIFVKCSEFRLSFYFNPLWLVDIC